MFLRLYDKNNYFKQSLYYSLKEKSTAVLFISLPILPSRSPSIAGREQVTKIKIPSLGHIDFERHGKPGTLLTHGFHFLNMKKNKTQMYAFLVSEVKPRICRCESENNFFPPSPLIFSVSGIKSLNSLILSSCMREV